MTALEEIADYAATFIVTSESAIDTARRCLIGALTRGLEALRDPDCASLVTPLVPGALMPGGARVPGTSLELDPAQAAFCLAVLFYPLESGDREPGLPSNPAAGPLAALLAVADYRARKATMEGVSPPKMRDVLTATVKAVEIQGVLALRNGHERSESWALPLTRLAVTAMATAGLGAQRRQIIAALGYACSDGGTWVDVANRSDTGRGHWATAEALSRAVRHGCQAVASGWSTHPTPTDLPTLGLADQLPQTTTSTAGQPFGTAMIERLVSRSNSPGAEPLPAGFRAAVDRHFPMRQAERIKILCATPERLDELPVNELLAALVTNGAR